MNKRLTGFLGIILIFGILTSCNTPPATPILIEVPTRTSVPTTPTVTPVVAVISVAPQTTQAIPVTGHLMRPADAVPPRGNLVYDVQSSRKAAPYGDSYNISLFERPFMPDMKYLPSVDIVNFNLSEDADWYYVSFKLSGDNPNNNIDIFYGVEIDQDANGFGDILIWGQPNYPAEWDTAPVKVYTDSDSGTAPDENGYETLLFDGAASGSADPDLAWVRLGSSPETDLQFAFKKSLAGPEFLLSVVADAGLRDVTKYDYNEHISLEAAGSPVRTSTNYPLKLLYAMDNTCWQAYGMQDGPFYVRKLCPPPPSAAATEGRNQNVRPTTSPSQPPAPTSIVVSRTSPPPTIRPTDPPLPTIRPTDPPQPTEPQPTEPPDPTVVPTDPPIELPTEPIPDLPIELP